MTNQENNQTNNQANNQTNNQANSQANSQANNQENSQASNQANNQDNSHLVDNHGEETTEGPLLETPVRKPASIPRDPGFASVPKRRRGDEEGFYFPRR